MESIYSPQELLRACGRRDPAAWTEFVNRYDKLIKLTVWRVLGSRRAHLAEDAVQHVYTRMLDRAPAIFSTFQLQREGSDFGFIQVVARRTVQDLLKTMDARQDQHAGSPNLSEIEEPGQSDDQVFVRIELRQAEEYLRRHLPSDEAERNIQILRFRYIHGYTAEAISRLPVFNLTRAGVDSVVFRCKQLLLESLKPH